MTIDTFSFSQAARREVEVNSVILLVTSVSRSLSATEVWTAMAGAGAAQCHAVSRSVTQLSSALAEPAAGEPVIFSLQ